MFSYASAARPVIIDTDVGVDDEIAILYLLKRQDIDIKAISIAGTGEAHCAFAKRNIVGLLALVNKSTIPVACGRSQPLFHHHTFPSWLRRDADQLSGAATFLPLSKQKFTDKSAVDLIIDTLQNSISPIDILAIGPLTNIAEALLKEPKIKKKIRNMTVMGGAIFVKGNVTELEPKIKNDKAEWNLYIDPLAASIVFRSTIPITLVPLDLTNQVPVDRIFYEKIKREQHSKERQFLYAMLRGNEKEIINAQWYFWDVLSAVILSDESLVTMANKKLEIALEESEMGTTRINNVKGKNVRVCMAINKNQFNKKFLDSIN